MEKGIDGKCFPFAAVAKEFRLIENETTVIYIPLREGEALVETLIAGRADRDTFRRLGQYGVNVYPNHLKALWEGGCLEQVEDSALVLRDMTQYCENTGLQMNVDTGNGFFI